MWRRDEQFILSVTLDQKRRKRKVLLRNWYMFSFFLLSALHSYTARSNVQTTNLNMSFVRSNVQTTNLNMSFVRSNDKLKYEFCQIKHSNDKLKYEFCQIKRSNDKLKYEFCQIKRSNDKLKYEFCRLMVGCEASSLVHLFLWSIFLIGRCG